MDTQTYRLTWQDIEIEAIYEPTKWQVIAHLEIHSINPERALLPITETGYRSHFHEIGTIEALGGDVVAQVIAWLDEERSAAWQSARWLDHVNRQNRAFARPTYAKAIVPIRHRGWQNRASARLMTG